jgi:cAMP-specific phosphodiesterase 4
MFFDRTTTNVAKSQIGFIDALVLPAFSLIVNVLPNLNHILTDLQANKANWTTLFNEYDDKKNDKNPFEPERLRWTGQISPQDNDSW